MKSITPFKALTKREQEILFFRGEKLTFREIGQKYGVSKQRACQIEQVALAKFIPLERAHLNVLWVKGTKEVLAAFNEINKEREELR